ncbi:MAG: hypothetical protein RL385_1776, partial [Pseudomonadota bacterium]
MLTLIDEAVAGGARLGAACDILNISTRSVDRWRPRLGRRLRRVVQPCATTQLDPLRHSRQPTRRGRLRDSCCSASSLPRRLRASAKSLDRQHTQLVAHRRRGTQPKQ